MSLKDNMEKQRNQGLRKVKREVTDDDYFIHPKLAEEFEEIITTLEGIKEGDFGFEMGDSNYILKGPPGVGKTLGVQYLATRLGIPLYDGKDLLNPQFMAQGFHLLRETVEKEKGPVMVLMDELDKYSNRDDVIDPVQQQTLNQFLIELDGTESNHGLFLFGATNQPNKLDNALRRPGRFGREIEFMPPDYKGRLKILNIHAGKPHNFTGEPEDLEYIADKTYGYTGSDLKGLLNRTFSRARNLVGKGERKRDKENRILVVREDFDYALKKTTPSALRDMPFKEPAKTLDDIAGYESHKGLMKNIIKNSEGSNILMYGGEGCGKTDFAEAVAGEYGFNFIVVKGSAPLDKFVGETDKELQKYLERAKMLAPCVLLFDEIDALVQKEGFEDWKSSWTGMLQSQLSKPIEGVYLFATLNRADRLNKAFQQRWEHKFFFDYPTKEEQEAMWRYHVGDDLNIESLLREQGLISGRDIYHAQKMIADYGLEVKDLSPEQATEMYNHFIREETDKQAREEYHRIRDTVGDGIQNYERVKEFLDGKEMPKPSGGEHIPEIMPSSTGKANSPWKGTPTEK